MKKLLFCLIATVIAITANAQIVKDLEYPRGHFGIRAAFTLNQATINQDYGSNSFSMTSGSLPFISGGLAADFRISTLPIYLETGLYYINRGWEIADSDSSFSYDYTENNHSITLPLLGSYHLYLTDNMSVQPFLGPYIGYGFDREEFDYGLRIGIGWNFGRLYANIGYDYGLEVDCFKTNTFFATIGFNIGGKY